MSRFHVFRGFLGVATFSQVSLLFFSFALQVSSSLNCWCAFPFFSAFCMFSWVVDDCFRFVLHFVVFLSS